MLYRLAPRTPLEWTDFPTRDLQADADKYGIDLDKFEWMPTEERTFSADLLRIALRHGMPSREALIVEAIHTLDLGRAEALRSSQQEIDTLQAKIRADNGARMEALMPGWTATGEEIDERVRESTEEAAREAEQDLAQVLAAPVDSKLVEHWTQLGGTTPSPA